MDALFHENFPTTATLCGTLAVLASTYVVVEWIKAVNYFKRLNIPGPTPLPLVGNLPGLIKLGINDHDTQIMNKYGRICGYFEASSPSILTTDIEFLKLLLIKDFHCFVNRRTFDGFSAEPFNKFLTVIKDTEWKNVRSIVTTAFTTSKLKNMSTTMKDCADHIIAHIEKIEKEGKLFDSKEAYGCFTLDIIATCCFGVCTDSINDPDSLFIKYLRKLFSKSFTKDPRVLILFLAPKLGRYLTEKKIIEFFPSDVINFFTQVTNEVLKKRRSKEEVRNDFIQIMVDHEENIASDAAGHKGDEEDGDKSQWKHLKKTLTDGEILAQALLFMFAGYETTSTTLNFLTYHLATNPDVQQKLFTEMSDALHEHGEISYEVLMNNLPYLDMVINETLRICPAAVRLDRICNRDYNFKNITIPKDSIITIPVWALHHDETLYPEPDKFIPERFANNKQSENVAFLPFGAGPRNCIGMRFALLEMKILISKIVLSYEILPTEHTPVPLKVENHDILRPVKPFLLKMKKRTD